MRSEIEDGRTDQPSSMNLDSDYLSFTMTGKMVIVVSVCETGKMIVVSVKEEKMKVKVDV